MTVKIIMAVARLGPPAAKGPWDRNFFFEKKFVGKKFLVQKKFFWKKVTNKLQYF